MSDITELDQRKPRNPLRVTWNVLSALVLREFTSQTMADRMGWFWMIFEPLATIAVMLWVREYLRGSMRHIVGADYLPWLVVGILAFFMFRECMMTPMGAINANRGMFAYRQVKPIDTVIARCIVGGLMRTFIYALAILVMSLLDVLDTPYDYLQVFVSLFGLWVMSSSLGILFSVSATLVPEVGKVIRLMTLPLMFLSGAMFPMTAFPPYLQQIMTWNPVFIFMEHIRFGFFQYYHSIPGLSEPYAWGCAVVVLTIGLIMHVRFQQRIIMQ